MVEATATINVSSGLHARPANLFIKTASKYKSDIKVSKDGKEVDGKRLLAIMTLGVQQGESITIKAEGEDESEAVRALEDLIERDFE
ncbi:MAG: HPr family phosphocarrier protein [Epulopiscium sp.]|nr:HPr family phosphocarrier protein [Candidatus Epulonipiscium sp.]